MIAKRLFDIFFAFVGLIITTPIFVYVAIRIKTDSKGPIFFNGTRAGLHGNPIKVYKFRTMFDDAHLMEGGSSSGDDDPRITNFGRRIRQSKLNEIPQLLNVLEGSMSFVGPRPEVFYYVDQFNGEEREILSVKPGITDFASIKFHNEGEILKGQPDPDKAYEELIRPEKLRLQIEYVKRRSFWVDIRIIFDTVKLVLLDS